mmetsp:Transcript_21248/g.22032  ORF Transcript_21248/g.22032 Transcript_21248/m.22032 type:complete len:137 (+) Transcript_21248:297-707(+)
MSKIQRTRINRKLISNSLYRKLAASIDSGKKTQRSKRVVSKKNHSTKASLLKKFSQIAIKPTTTNKRVALAKKAKKAIRLVKSFSPVKIAKSKKGNEAEQLFNEAKVSLSKGLGAMNNMRALVSLRSIKKEKGISM